MFSFAIYELRACPGCGNFLAWGLDDIIPCLLCVAVFSNETSLVLIVTRLLALAIMPQKFWIFICLDEDYTYVPCSAKMALRNRPGQCIVRGLKLSPTAVVQLLEGFNGILFLNPTLLLSRPFINLGYNAYVCLH